MTTQNLIEYTLDNLDVEREIAEAESFDDFVRKQKDLVRDRNFEKTLAQVESAQEVLDRPRARIITGQRVAFQVRVNVIRRNILNSSDEDLLALRTLRRIQKVGKLEEDEARQLVEERGLEVVGARLRIKRVEE